MQAGGGAEQVPHHELHVVQEAGQQKLQLSVKLPGLASASDIQLACTSSSISLTVPGQYALQLPLDVTISNAADSVKFMKKKQTLCATLIVISGNAAASAGVANGSSSINAGQQHQQAADAAQRAAAAAAAEEAARREQQRRINTEAAEEWMRRGIEAARSGNSQLAEKALAKVGELAPHLNTAVLRTGIAAAKQPQQKQQQQQQKGPQAAAAGANSTNSSQQPRQQQQQQPPPSSGARQPNSSSSNAQQQSSSSAGAQQAGNANSSSGGARPSSQQQQQQQKQHPKHKHKQKQPPTAKPPQQQPQQQQGSSSSSGPSSSQQQQQQQEHDADGDYGFSRSAWEQQQAAKAAGGGLVGWWCRGYDALELWLMATGEALNAWSKEPGRRWVASTAAQLCAVLLVATHFVVMWLWRTGWTQPLHCLAYIRRTGGDTFIESQLWLGHTAIALTQHTLAAAAWRILLCGVSASCTAVATWAVGWMQLGGHSLVGWGWLLLRGIWRALVWRPWHSVQLPLAVVAVFVFGFGGLGGDIALWSLAMMMMPGSWMNLSGWLLAAAASFGLLPFIPRITWPTSILGTVLLAKAVNMGCCWWGVEAFSSPVDPLPHVSWWWWLLLLVLHVLVALMQTAEKMREEEERAKHGGGASSSSNFGRSHADDEPFYGGASEIAYQKFVMGFGPVPVPEGCEVAEVKAALQARDYYQVMGFSSREECTPESLRAARKAKALAVHPDKVGHDHPGANQAAGRVNKAFETLSSEESRRAYDRLLDCHSRPRAASGSSNSRRGAAAAAAGGRAATPEDAAWLPPYSDSLYDVERSPAYMVDMDCPNGGHSHTVYILPQAPFGVRWCRECNTWHNTREVGEVWAHWSPGLGGVRMLGRVRLLLAPSPNSPIFDITDIFKCGGKLVSSASICNTHSNQFADMMSAGRAGIRGGGSGGGGGDSGGSRRSRKKQGRRR